MKAASLATPKWKLFRLLDFDAGNQVHVQVPEIFALEAQAILADVFAKNLIPLEGNLTSVCPKCGSLEYAQIDERKQALLLALLLSFTVRHTGIKRECKSCGEITRT